MQAIATVRIIPLAFYKSQPVSDPKDIDCIIARSSVTVNKSKIKI